jgi:hypothetical protein
MIAALLAFAITLLFTVAAYRRAIRRKSSERFRAALYRQLGVMPVRTGAA